MPLTQLTNQVLEETFLKWLNPIIKVELDVLESVGLAQMMRLAQKIEDWELMRLESDNKGLDGNIAQGQSAKANPNTSR